jgi:hypothetical protein
MRVPPQKAVVQPPATDPPGKQPLPGGKTAALHLHEVDRHLGGLQGDSIFVQNFGRTGNYHGGDSV